MKSHTTVSRALVLLAFFSGRPATAQSPDAPVAVSSAEAVYDSLNRLPYLPHGREVKDLAFRQGPGTFLLERGSLTFVAPVRGRITGAYFEGEGRFRLALPDEMERGQVRRFLDTDSVDINFCRAYFRFTANPFRDRLPEPGRAPRRYSGKLAKQHRRHQELLWNKLHLNLDARLLSDLMCPLDDRYLYADITQQAPRPDFSPHFIFTYEPRDEEEIGLAQYFPRRARKPYYTIASFPDTHTIRPDPGPVQDLVTVHSYEMEVELERGGKAEVQAKLMLTAGDGPVCVVPFRLHEDLEIDGVEDEAGVSIPFVREEDEPRFYLLLAEPLAIPDTLRFIIRYHGPLVKKHRDGRPRLIDSIFWYPHYRLGQWARYDVRFSISRDRTLAASGIRGEETTGSKHIQVRYHTPEPVRFFSFIYGRYDPEKHHLSDSTRVALYPHHISTSKALKYMREDLLESLECFADWFGPLPYPEVSVGEIGGMHGQGFPALIHLTPLMFNHQVDGYMAAFRAHEVAHQWWGHQVGWRSYHDQWLSEGFAEYAAAMFVERTPRTSRFFREIVQAWHDDIIHQGHIGVKLGMRRFNFSAPDMADRDGAKAGPVWMGIRLGARSLADYYVLTYEKGAYVLHMMRGLFSEFGRKDDARFLDLLHDVIHQYRGRDLSTQAFRRLAEEHYGGDLRWFFDQWVYGVEIPRYRLEWHSVPGPEGVVVRGVVHQSGVVASFRMMMPVNVDLAGTGTMREALWVTGERTEFELGPFDRGPRKVEMNRNLEVLCESE